MSWPYPVNVFLISFLWRDNEHAIVNQPQVSEEQWSLQETSIASMVLLLMLQYVLQYRDQCNRSIYRS